jgi:hypothetical protein
MRLVTLVLIFIVFQLVIVPPLLSAILRGRVLCENGKPFPYPVKIEVREYPTILPVTDENGQYTLTLPPGRYTFGIEGRSFDVFIYPQNTPMDFYLPCK